MTLTKYGRIKSNLISLHANKTKIITSKTRSNLAFKEDKVPKIEEHYLQLNQSK